MNPNQNWDLRAFMVRRTQQSFGDEYVCGDCNIAAMTGLQDSVFCSQHFESFELIDIQRRKRIHKRKELTWWWHFDSIESPNLVL
jgi:hypothetical protein